MGQSGDCEVLVAIAGRNGAIRRHDFTVVVTSVDAEGAAQCLLISGEIGGERGGAIVSWPDVKHVILCRVLVLSTSRIRVLGRRHRSR